MNVNALLSTVILVAFIVTVVLAIGSYMAYKLRERNRGPQGRVDIEGEPVFFERVYPAALTRTSPDRARDARDTGTEG